MPSRPRRSGFATLIGAPSVGKSTLLNRLTGAKLAIVSPKPQTTRARVVGVVNRPSGQVAFVDTPGVHRAQGALSRHLVEIALSALGEVDLLLLMIDARTASKEPTIDEFLRTRLLSVRKPIFLVINKIDLVPKPRLLHLIESSRHQLPFAEVIPVSAKTGDGVEELLELVLSQLPEGEPLFQQEMLTDQAERALAADYIREQVFLRTHQEIPYSAAVTVDDFDESERTAADAGEGKGRGGLVRISATIHLERQSQRGIVIGKGGKMLKAIGTAARLEIERLLGARVYLSLLVRVEPGWSNRPDSFMKRGYR
jgi:GTP-binding protein Era